MYSNVVGKDSPCYHSNCAQTCTVINNGTTAACGCFSGYTVDPSDPKACKPMLQGCNGTFACGGDCIPWELTCDGVNHCQASDANAIPADENPLFCGRYH